MPGLLGLRFLLEPCGDVSAGWRAEVEALGEDWMGRELMSCADERGKGGETERAVDMMR